MPLYEYCCLRCQTRFELLRPAARADEPTICPNCQGNEARRLISTFAAFSKSESGASAAVAGSSGCAGCSASSCAQCRA